MSSYKCSITGGYARKHQTKILTTQLEGACGAEFVGRAYYNDLSQRSKKYYGKFASLHIWEDDDCGGWNWNVTFYVDENYTITKIYVDGDGN